MWLLIAAIAVGYAVALTRLGPRLAPTGTAGGDALPDRDVLGRVCSRCWVASDWPIHDLGERYLFSVHMVQHTVYSIIAAPLLLMGTPAWLARWLLTPRWLLRTVRYLARLIPATIIFNLVVIVTHTPVVVNVALHHALVHFAVHALIVVSSLARVDAAAEPAARGAAAAAARADALLVPAVGGPDGAGVVPHVRRPSAVPLLRDGAAAVGRLRARTTCRSRD